MIIPRTTKLTFNISLSGTHANKTLVKNLGRNIIRKLVMKIKGNEIICTDDCDILCSYYDCWKTKAERHNAVFQGIVKDNGQMKNAISPKWSEKSTRYGLQPPPPPPPFSLSEGQLKQNLVV